MKIKYQNVSVFVSLNSSHFPVLTKAPHVNFHDQNTKKREDFKYFVILTVKL